MNPEPITFTFEEACKAVADVFEAIPEAWTKNTYARTEHGGSVWMDDLRACSWCSKGALMSLGMGVSPLGKIADAMGYQSIAHANDGGGRSVAIRMLRIASGELPMPKGRK